MSQLSKELFIYGLGGILNRGIGFLLIPLYTSYLTVEEYGMLAILGVILQLVGLVSLMGVGTAAMRFYHNEGADEDYRKKLVAGLGCSLFHFWSAIGLLSITLNTPSIISSM